ncbi:MAG: hypothetical protein ABSA13_08120 [Beijerinckiaceae bacterium]|jgi:DNA-binding MltR family transcriptional regulator
MARIRADEVLKGLDTDAVLTMAFDSPDWPTVIMIGSFLELVLERAISTQFRPDQPLNTERRAELFDGYGPFASFSSKISVTYALGLLAKESRDDLNIIKRIRNDAAHRIDHFSFDNLDTKQKCNSLTLTKRSETGEIPLSNKDKTLIFQERLDSLGANSPRAKFIISFTNILADVVMKMLWSIQFRATTVLLAMLIQKKISPEKFKEIAAVLKVDHLLEGLDLA